MQAISKVTPINSKNPMKITQGEISASPEPLVKEGK